MGGCVSAQIGCVGNESKKKNSGKKNKPTSRRRRGGAIRRRVCLGLSDSSSLDAHNNNNKRSARPSTDRSFTNHTFQDQNMGDAMKGGVMDVVHSTVFKESEKLEGKHIKIEGYDFNQGVDYTKMLNSYCSTGFQASSLGEAIEVVNQMLEWKLSAGDPAEDCSEEEIDKVYRDSVRFRVDVVVTTAGGVEEDLVKCLAPTYKGEFSLPGALLRSKGLNRIGNLLVPNENYCQFEDWILPVFDKMLEDQHSEDIAGTCTLAMEVAEDSAQVAKLRFIYCYLCLHW